MFGTLTARWEGPAVVAARRTLRVSRRLPPEVLAGDECRADCARSGADALPTPRRALPQSNPCAAGHLRGTAMGYAKYIGRVGALAVALGFGAAVATATPG